MPISPQTDHPDSNAWRMFRIMGEFANGFQVLSELPKAIAIFGSARTEPAHPHYRSAVELGRACVERGFPVITGGGPGIMEAGNKGAKEAGGDSIGMCIQLPFEQSHNAYITTALDFHYFFVRKVMFLKNTAAIVVMPGGFGTMDEVFESATLVQTHKIAPIPIILYDRSFWSGLIEWLERSMHEAHGFISPGDTDLLQLADSPEEVMQLLADLRPTRNGHDVP